MWLKKLNSLRERKTSAPAPFSDFTKAAEFVEEERRVLKSHPLAYQNEKVRLVNPTHRTAPLRACDSPIINPKPLDVGNHPENIIKAGWGIFFFAHI